MAIWDINIKKLAKSTFFKFSAMGKIGNEKRPLHPSEWVNWGEPFPERLAGEEVGGVFYSGKSGPAFLRLCAKHPSPL